MTDYSILPNANMQILAETAENLGINITILDATSGRLQLEKDGHTHIVWQKSLGINSPESIEKSRNKKTVSDLLKANNLPVPEEVVISTIADLSTTLLPPFPLVAKPVRGEKGKGVFALIRSQSSLQQVLSGLLKTQERILIQTFIEGFNDRLFVLNGQVIGAARRHPPTIIGNGHNTIRQLIQNYNENLLRQREKSRHRAKNRLNNWPRIKWHLENQGLSLETILEKDQEITLYPISNFQTGGSVETIPVSQYHPEIIAAAKKAVTLTGLTVAGVDLMVKDHTMPMADIVVFLEINSDPGLRLHEWPNKGIPQPVTAALLTYLFQTIQSV